MDANIIMFGKHLDYRINYVYGDWISKAVCYEEGACSDFGLNLVPRRYCDCEYNGLYIEMKKGKSSFLFDEIRYCEILMKTSYGHKKETITMAMLPSASKDKIDRIYLIDTQKIIKALELTPEWATCVLSRKEKVKRSLKYFYTLTAKDLRELSDYTVYYNYNRIN